MARSFVTFIAAVTILISIGCGGGSGSGTSVTLSGGDGQSDVPTLNSIAPSSATVGASSLTIVAYGSNFQYGAQIEWNGTALPTSCVDINLNPISCSTATELTATVPASDFATAGTAKVTVSNAPNSLNFNISQPSTGKTWLRAVAGISAPNSIVADTVHGKLYASVSAQDAANPNTIAVIDPISGSATSFVPAGTNPNLLSISSGNGYLWVGLDGSYSVQRFLLPALSPDISFLLPRDSRGGNPQTAIALQAAPVNPHTLALIAGYLPQDGEGGDGVYVYDDATPRPNNVPNSGANGGAIDWMQWGADDGTIYGDQLTTIDEGGIAVVNVNSSGATLANYGGGLYLQPTITQFNAKTGLLYSYGAAYDPVKLSLVGTFALPEPSASACTVDSGLGRYFCAISNDLDGTDVVGYELWVFDLNSYALLNRVYFGVSAGTPVSIVTGSPRALVRWGNAGLALSTGTGVFLIDGAAVNPNVAPDVTSGTPEPSYSWLSSMTPDSATNTSGQVAVTIMGHDFSAASTACWNCSFLQERFLPTTFVSSTQLNVTIPLSDVSSTAPLEVTVFDPGSNLFSTNGLTFSVLASAGNTTVTPLNICGLAAAWDQNSQRLYVATADYDGAYPNSVVALDPTTGNVTQSQHVASDPAFLSDSANGQYLYVAYSSATNLTQLALPGLTTATTAPLRNSLGQTFPPGDMKAAPQDPNTAAATLIMPGWDPEELGGVVVLVAGAPSPNSLPGWGAPGAIFNALYDTVAWSASDQLLTAAPSPLIDGSGPLYSLQVDSSAISFLGQGSATFNTAGYIHSDFGTNLIYSDGGNVADPSTGVIVGTYGASGLVAPDSSLNRVFILGQTAAQANTNNYTIQSFDQKAFTPVSSITLENISGSPIELVRWGTNGLALLTSGGLDDIYENGNGMLYLIQDSTFVSSAPATASIRHHVTERVHQRWKRMTVREHLAAMRRITAAHSTATINTNAAEPAPLPLPVSNRKAAPRRRAPPR